MTCWGCNNLGKLGHGAGPASAVPVAVTGITTATVIAAGWDHTCATLSSGAVRCWGYNGSGQLGDGTTNDSLVPVAVVLLPFTDIWGSLFKTDILWLYASGITDGLQLDPVLSR